MFISGLVLTAGGAVAGSWGIQTYRNSRNSRNSHNSRSRPTLIQMLSLDHLIPPSPKVQNEILYAAQSPWKDQRV